MTKAKTHAFSESGAAGSGNSMAPEADADCEFCGGTGIWGQYEWLCDDEPGAMARSVWTESACPVGCEIDAEWFERKLKSIQGGKPDE